MFTSSVSSTKRPVREFPVVHVQWRQRNVRKKCAARAELLFRALFVLFLFCKSKFRYRSTGRIFNRLKNKTGHFAHMEPFNILLCSQELWTATRLNFRTVKGLRIGTEHLLRCFKVLKLITHQYSADRKFVQCHVNAALTTLHVDFFFCIVSVTGQLYSGQNYSTLVDSLFP